MTLFAPPTPHQSLFTTKQGAAEGAHNKVAEAAADHKDGHAGSKGDGKVRGGSQGVCAIGLE